MKYQNGNNLTFCGDDPFWANACVGTNGNPQIVDYANGFSAAANLLIEQVISDEGTEYPVDTFIYPICFNMRHAVELHLKSTAVVLSRLAQERKKIDKFDLAGSHDLGNIWKYITSNALNIDARYGTLLTELAPYVNDLADIDATGQVFRYPYDNENKKHLTEVNIINILVLRRRFGEMERKLEALHSFNLNLIEEYSLKSYTTDLSRAQIFEIAALLPPYNKWREEQFDEARAGIRKKYSISNKQLTNAIDIIKKHYEMAQLIELELPLPNATISMLQDFFDVLFEIYPLSHEPSKPVVVNLSSIREHRDSFQASAERHSVKVRASKELALKIRPEELATLFALYYFQRERQYSERYQVIYDSELPSLSLLHDKFPDQYRQKFFDLLSKKTAAQYILRSLYSLGQYDLAETLCDRYGLTEQFEWLAAVREKLKSKTSSVIGKIDPYLIITNTY